MKHRNMHSIIQFYSPADVDDNYYRVDREEENK